MGKIHALRTKTERRDERSPERQALANAIEEYNRHTAELNAVDEAMHNAEKATFAARRLAERATEAIEEAKEAASKYQTDLLLGKNPSPPLSIKAARAVLTEAEDDLAVSRETLAGLEKHRETLAHFDNRERRSADAAKAVAASEIDGHKIHRDYLEAVRALNRAQTLLHFAQWVGALPATRVSTPENLLSPSQQLFEGMIAPLLQNPDAALPELAV